METNTLSKNLNRESKSWSLNTRKELVSSQSTAGIESYSGALKAKVSFKLFKEYSEINLISFRFSLHGMFVEYGVGKGQKSGQQGNRQPKIWLGNVLENEQEKLADILADAKGETVIKDVANQINIRK